MRVELLGQYDLKSQAGATWTITTKLGATVSLINGTKLELCNILYAPQTTDICDHALESLSKSKVKAVYIIGRRGPMQVWTLPQPDLQVNQLLQKFASRPSAIFPVCCCCFFFYLFILFVFGSPNILAVEENVFIWQL